MFVEHAGVLKITQHALLVCRKMRISIERIMNPKISPGVFVE